MRTQTEVIRRAMIACIVVIAAVSAYGQSIPNLGVIDTQRAQEAADEGDAAAAYLLGTAFFYGRGTSRDVPSAVRWFERAGDLGIAYAQWHLAEFYHEGTLVPEHDEKALRWAQASARQGIESAQYLLGSLYLDGRGTGTNLQQAAFWFQEAAGQGYAPAQYSLGLMYAQGRGVPEDRRQAYEWIILAAAGGYAEAIADKAILRKQIDDDIVVQAQRLAEAFEPRPHYGKVTVDRQIDLIKERAKELRPIRD